MSNYRSLIDEAMRTARYRLDAGIDKEASVPSSSITKEASELANALEYMAISASQDGTVAGQARSEIVRDFFKSATSQRLGVKLAGDVGESPTSTSGSQALAPSGSKTKLKPLKTSGGDPLVSETPDSTGNKMLESFKQADGEGSSLYEILMMGKEADSPAQMDAEDSAPGIPSKNENSNRSLLKNKDGIANITKAQAKAPVRARLAEAFASTSDTTGNQSASSIFPQATAKGGLKKNAGVSIKDRLIAMAQGA